MKHTANGTQHQSQDKTAHIDHLPKAEAIKQIEALREEAIDDKSTDEQDEP